MARPARTVVIHNHSRGAVLADRAELRDGIIGRGRGLLGRAGLPAGAGIVLSPCNSVHMAFMRFAIDVVYVNKQQQVVKVVPRLRPFAVSVGGRGAYQAIELPVGVIAATATAPGDQLTYEAAA